MKVVSIEVYEKLCLKRLKKNMKSFFFTKYEHKTFFFEVMNIKHNNINNTRVYI
jgi:hypothetical protein